jgi:hypothetical protein
MTTDTFPKVATRRVQIGQAEVTINGMAKGAGMIAPDMATMLAFVFTDAAVAAPVLQQLLTEGTETSFNCVTVDGDTSTSDTLLLFATARRAARDRERGGSGTSSPSAKRSMGLLIELAQLVARDGEGARKFVTVEVAGAESDRSAHRIAMSIANSPLVKTAIAGQDANWGRVVMAVGKAGEPADRDRLAISFGDVRVAVDGARDPDYSEEAASDVMRKDEVTVRVDLGLAAARPACGPAISPRPMSRSTGITARDGRPARAARVLAPWARDRRLGPARRRRPRAWPDQRCRGGHDRGSARLCGRADRRHVARRDSCAALWPTTQRRLPAPSRSRRAAGVDARDIATSAVSLAQAFKNVRTPTGGEQQPDGYQAQNVVTVRLADMAKLGEFMRQAVEGGANRIDGVSVRAARAREGRARGRGSRDA